MPRKPKPPVQLTNEEALRRLFPSRVVSEAHKQVKQEPKPQVRKPKSAIKRKGT